MINVLFLQSIIDRLPRAGWALIGTRGSLTIIMLWYVCVMLQMSRCMRIYSDIDKCLELHLCRDVKLIMPLRYSATRLRQIAITDGLIQVRNYLRSI